MQFVLFKFLSRWLPNLLIYKGLNVYSIAYGKRLVRSGPPVDGPKDHWPRVLSLPGRFVGDPASLARDNILRVYAILITLHASYKW